MAWDDSPPTDKELTIAKSAPAWDESPPTDAELKTAKLSSEIGGPSEPESWGKQLVRHSINGLVPMAGAIGGAILAGPETLGVGSIPAGALGYAGGKQLARVLNHQFLGDDADTPTTLGGMAKQTAGDIGEGALAEFGGQVTGKALDAAAGQIAPLTKSLGETAQAAANDRAASALGMTKGIRKKLGDDVVQEVGRSGLDNNVVGWTGGAKKMLSRAQDLSESSGKTIGDTMSALDSQGVKEFNPIAAATRADSEVGAPYRDEPLFKGLSNQYENALDTILKRADPTDLSKNISFADAQKLKGLFGKYGYNEGIAVPGKEMAQQLGGVVGDELENAVTRGAAKLSDSEMAQRYLAAKKDYGSSLKMQTALEDRVAKQGNQGDIVGGFLGLKNAGAKMLGGSVAGPLGAVGGDVAANGVRAFGDQVGAKSLDSVSKFLLQTPRFAQMAKTNPTAFRALVLDMSARTGSGAQIAMPAAASNELDNDSSKSSSYQPDHTPGDHEAAKQSFLDGN